MLLRVPEEVVEGMEVPPMVRLTALVTVIQGAVAVVVMMTEPAIAEAAGMIVNQGESLVAIVNR